MTRYRKISIMQDPFDVAQDDNTRALVVFNVEIEKSRSEQLEEEIIKILTDASVGTSNTNIFGSSNRLLPDGEGPYLRVIATGGIAPEEIHNQVLPNVQRPQVQISVHASTYAAARAMAWDAHDALAAVINQSVIP